MIIDRFSDEYEFLSNFYYAPIWYDGLAYRTNEHAFQASKTMDEQTRFLIASLEKPGQAKKSGRTVELRKGWEGIKISIMKEICLLKFFYHDDLRTKLVQTGQEELIEGNNWSDFFWGVCDGKGENHLGIILMEIRSKLK